MAQQTVQLQLQRLAFGFGFYLKPRLSELIEWAQRSRETSTSLTTSPNSNLAH